MLAVVLLNRFDGVVIVTLIAVQVITQLFVPLSAVVIEIRDRLVRLVLVMLEIALHAGNLFEHLSFLRLQTRHLFLIFLDVIV